MPRLNQRGLRVVAGIVALLLILYLALISIPSLDRLVYRSPLAGAPEALKTRLRPLRAPLAVDVYPAKDAKEISPSSAISITFSVPMNHALTERAIKIEPALPGTFGWKDNTLVFNPQAPEAWAPNTVVTVTVGTGARSWLLRAKEKALQTTFTVVGPPAVVATTPATNARYAFITGKGPESNVTMTFNRPMDEKSVTDRITVSPAPAGLRFGWVENRLFLYGAWQPSTSYQIKLMPGARDRLFGTEMRDAFSFGFTTTRRPPWLGITAMGYYGLLSAYEPRSFPVEAVNVSALDLKLYRLDTASYLKIQGFSWNDRRSYKPNLPLVRSWQEPVETQPDMVTSVPVELGDLAPGLYFLAVSSPEGTKDAQVLVVSRSALTMKRTDTQALVWATDMAQGQVIPGMEVTLYDQKGQKLASGLTDEKGVFLSALPKTTGPIHALGTRPGDVAAVAADWQAGVEPWRFTGIPWQWQVETKEHRVFVYTDRPLYRPGQTVYFKGIVRQDKDGEYSQPPPGTAVYVSVSNWDNQVIYKKTLKATPFGSISDSFLLNREVKLGEYQIRAEVGKEPGAEARWQYQSAIRVEEYRKPEFEVSVRTDRSDYVNGEVISATVQARYYFGAPVANTKVRYALYANDYWFYWAANEDFDFGEVTQRYWGYGKEIFAREATTDADGLLALTIPANVDTEQRSQVFTLEASVMDPTNQPVSGFKSVIVHRGLFYIGAKPDKYVATRGQKASFSIQTLDTKSRPAGPESLSYTISRIEWRNTREYGPKGYLWRPEPVTTTMAAGSLVTGLDGTAHLDFIPPTGGSYQLELIGVDARGNRVLGSAWLWVSDTALVRWRWENNDRIELRADKKRYRPGEIARVLVASPYQNARALVTVERGRIISHRLVELDSNSAILEFPVEKSYFPNVFVSVALIPQGERPSFKVGYAELQVEDESNALQVNISPDKAEHRPGEKATYTVKAVDSAGKPARAEFSLGVVDAAIYALAGDTTKDIVDAFWGRRNLGVQSAYSLAILLNRHNLREDWGGGDLGAEQGLRKIFPDTAYWNPVIETDELGVARVEVTLPDNLTTWRAFAKGVTADTKAGAARADLIVNKELIVRPILPRFLMIGDRAVVGALVHNYTGREVEVEVALQAQGVTLEDKPQPGSNVAIPNGETRKFTWAVKVDKVEKATLRFRATALAPGGAADAVEISLPVLPFGEKAVVAEAGETPELALRTLELPRDAIFPKLTVDTAPSLAAGLVDSLDYLTGYPYGCIEQTMSRFLPDVLVSQAMKTLSIENARLKEELPKMVEDGLTRIYAMQRYDGGWGWWEGDAPDPRITAYVVYGLNEAKKAGFPVNQRVLERGAKALREPLVKTDDLNLKAYLVYVLTEYGEGDISLSRSILDRQASLTLESRAYLAMALQATRSPAEARALTDDLLSKAIVTATGAHWQEVQEERKYMASSGRTTAVILQALMRVDPKNPVVPKVVRWLMESRRGGYWRTTQETAATLIALTEYLGATKELQGNFTYQVAVNGRQVKERGVTHQDIAERDRVVVNDPRPGGNEVKITKQGPGLLYYSAYLEYYQERDRIEAGRSSDGPVVRRDYLDPKTGKTLTQVKAGDLVQVRLTIDVPGELWYVVIEDPLPAGLEAVNESLRTTSVREGKVLSYWSHPELRDDKAAFFAYWMWPGQHTYTYLARAATPGTFRVLPTYVYPMYNPETWGRGRSEVMTVAE